MQSILKLRSSVKYITHRLMKDTPVKSFMYDVNIKYSYITGKFVGEVKMPKGQLLFAGETIKDFNKSFASSLKEYNKEKKIKDVGCNGRTSIEIPFVTLLFNVVRDDSALPGLKTVELKMNELFPKG